MKGENQDVEKHYILLFANKIMAKSLLSITILILKSISTVKAITVGTGSCEHWIGYGMLAVSS